jgi:hypothetical protein
MGNPTEDVALKVSCESAYTVYTPTRSLTLCKVLQRCRLDDEFVDLLLHAQRCLGRLVVPCFSSACGRTAIASSQYLVLYSYSYSWVSAIGVRWTHGLTRKLPLYPSQHSQGFTVGHTASGDFGHIAVPRNELHERVVDPVEDIRVGPP